jgi:integral membrane protein (TIGR01906 family)
MTPSEASTKPVKTLTIVLSWIVTILIPLALTLTAVRLVFGTWYLTFEYNSPGFPVDYYGFSTQERLYWASNARDYLLNSAGIEFLGDLRFENGTAVYNERELGHMLDVKNVIQTMFKVWYGSLILLAGLGLWAWQGKWSQEYLRGVGRGGWLTVFLVGTIVVFALVSFGVFFVAFHNVFFDPGTWQFEFSDTLIRLFPQRFWRDIFLIVGGITVAVGLGLALVFRKR